MLRTQLSCLTLTFVFAIAATLGGCPDAVVGDLVAPTPSDVHGGHDGHGYDGAGSSDSDVWDGTGHDVAGQDAAGDQGPDVEADAQVDGGTLDGQVTPPIWGAPITAAMFIDDKTQIIGMSKDRTRLLVAQSYSWTHGSQPGLHIGRLLAVDVLTWRASVISDSAVLPDDPFNLSLNDPSRPATVHMSDSGESILWLAAELPLKADSTVTWLDLKKTSWQTYVWTKSASRTTGLAGVVSPGFVPGTDVSYFPGSTSVTLERPDGVQQVHNATKLLADEGVLFTWFEGSFHARTGFEDTLIVTTAADADIKELAPGFTFHLLDDTTWRVLDLRTARSWTFYDMPGVSKNLGKSALSKSRREVAIVTSTTTGSLVHLTLGDFYPAAVEVASGLSNRAPEFVGQQRLLFQKQGATWMRSDHFVWHINTGVEPLAEDGCPTTQVSPAQDSVILYLNRCFSAGSKPFERRFFGDGDVVQTGFASNLTASWFGDLVLFNEAAGDLSETTPGTLVAVPTEGTDPQSLGADGFQNIGRTLDDGTIVFVGTDNESTRQDMAFLREDMTTVSVWSDVAAENVEMGVVAAGYAVIVAKADDGERTLHRVVLPE